MVATSTISADTITPASSLRKFLIMSVLFVGLLQTREREKKHCIEFIWKSISRHVRVEPTDHSLRQERSMAKALSGAEQVIQGEALLRHR
jgi:hypothetical protein